MPDHQMRLDQSHRMEQRLEQRLNQQLIQKLEILQLPALELQDRINKELQENPVLTENPEEPKKETNIEDDQELIERLSVRRDASRPYVAYSEDDEDNDRMANVSIRSGTINEHLASQLGYLELEPGMRALVELLIDRLDERGYMKETFDKIIDALPPGLGIPQDQIQAKLAVALHVVQSLEPRGVGARDVKECLLLQLEEHDANYEIKRYLIENHFETVMRQHYTKLAKALRADPKGVELFDIDAWTKDEQIITQAKAIVEELKLLDPNPGARYTFDPLRPVVPEVVIREVDGEYEVDVRDEYIPKVGINQGYLELLRSRSTEKDVKLFLRGKLEKAKMIIDSIVHRKSTIRKVAEKLLEHQRDFFEKGPEFMRPLHMKEVAQEIGVSVSTISRAVSGKYAETPRGVYPLKFFFASSINKTPGLAFVFNYPVAPQSKVSVLEKISEMISTEDKNSPLSDSEIADALRKEGINVARRTVTKYREQLRIASAPQRRVRRKKGDGDGEDE